MKNIISLSRISKKDIQHTGGKGASLGELLKIGMNVPKGFVITSTAFETVEQETGLTEEINTILKTVNTETIHTVEKAANHIQSLIKNTAFPKTLESQIHVAFSTLGAQYVAVRSSATQEDGQKQSWAGQLHTTLNAYEKTLIPSIKQCWASFYTPRALFYRNNHKKNNNKSQMAVIVQKMIASTIAGTAFSVHPITENNNQVLIEAGWGLGEAIASGEITPDSYIIKKDTLQIINTTVNTQKKALARSFGGGNEWVHLAKTKQKKRILTNKKLVEIVHATNKIEKHFVAPVDIEWGMEGETLYILQARPITTLT